MKDLTRFRTTEYNERLPIHPAVHLFFYLTLIKGFMFVFFGWTDVVSESYLWQSTNGTLGWIGTNLWGVSALTITALNTVAIAGRKPRLHNNAAIAGFMLWLFAAGMYALGGFWYYFLILAVPNLAFWTYYYLETKKRTSPR